MADMKIDDAPRDTAITGTELVPISDNSVPKSATTAQIRDFALAAIIAATGVAPSDTVNFVSTDGETIKTSSAASLFSYIVGKLFGAASATTVADTDKIIIRDNSGQKIMSVAVLAQSVAAKVPLNLSDKAEVTALGGGDYFLVSQNNTANKVTLNNLGKAVLNGIGEWLATVTAISAPADSAVLIAVSGTTPQKITFGNLKNYFGNVKCAATTVENMIPQWDAAQKTLKGGLELATEVRASGAASDSSVPTEAAVRSAIAGSASGMVTPSSVTQGNIVQWGANSKTLAAGLALVTAVRDATHAMDSAVATEKAVRAALAAIASISVSGNPPEGNIPQWGEDKSLTVGLAVTAILAASGIAADDRIPTEKAVRDAVDGMASASSEAKQQGYVPQWEANGENVLAAGLKVLSSIRASGSTDGSLVTETAVRSAIVQAVSDASSFALDSFGTPTDSTRLDATPALHGLMSKADKSKLNGIEAQADRTTAEKIIAAGALQQTMLDTDVTLAAASDAKIATQKAVKTYADTKDALKFDKENVDASATLGGAGASDSKVATQKAVKTYVDSTTAADFTGATASAAGSHGLVPAPAAGQQSKFLKADGNWATPPSASGLDVDALPAASSVSGSDMLPIYDGVELKKASVAQIEGRRKYRTLFVPAGAITPCKTAGATAETVEYNGLSHDVITFKGVNGDTAADFTVDFGYTWNGGAVKMKLLWTPAANDVSEGEVVGFHVSGFVAGDGESISTTPGAAVTIADACQGYGKVHTSGASGEITLGGTPSGGKFAHFHLLRKFNYATGGAAMDVGCQLLGVEIQYAESGEEAAW